jgi:hypothetical protein
LIVGILHLSVLITLMLHDLGRFAKLVGLRRSFVMQLRKRNSKKELFEFCVLATWR